MGEQNLSMSWKNSIFFKTNYKMIEGTIDTIKLYVKYPCSDFRQKIDLIDTLPEPVKKELISRGSHELYTYEFDSPSENLELITRFNAVITPINYPVSKAPFPVILENDFVNYYLQETPLVQSGDPEIREMSENLTALTKTLTNALLRIVNYFNSYIKKDTACLESRQSAIETLKSKKGSCEDVNHLFNALCRAVNIPSRLAMGFSKGNSGWGRHVWSEVYDPQFGWFPIDLLYEPSQIGYVDASHLKLMTALDSSESEIRVEYDFPANNPSPTLLLNHSLFIDRSVIPYQIEISKKE